MTRFPLLIMMSTLLLNRLRTSSCSEGNEKYKIFSNSGEIYPNITAMMHSSCMAFRYCGLKINSCLFLTASFHISEVGHSFAMYAPMVFPPLEASAKSDFCDGNLLKIKLFNKFQNFYCKSSNHVKSHKNVLLSILRARMMPK